MRPELALYRSLQRKAAVVDKIPALKCFLGSPAIWLAEQPSDVVRRMEDLQAAGTHKAPLIPPETSAMHFPKPGEYTLSPGFFVEETPDVALYLWPSSWSVRREIGMLFRSREMLQMAHESLLRGVVFEPKDSSSRPPLWWLAGTLRRRSEESSVEQIALDICLSLLRMFNRLLWDATDAGVIQSTAARSRLRVPAAPPLVQGGACIAGSMFQWEFERFAAARHRMRPFLPLPPDPTPRPSPPPQFRMRMLARPHPGCVMLTHPLAHKNASPPDVTTFPQTTVLVTSASKAEGFQGVVLNHVIAGTQLDGLFNDDHIPGLDAVRDKLLAIPLHRGGPGPAEGPHQVVCLHTYGPELGGRLLVGGATPLYIMEVTSDYLGRQLVSFLKADEERFLDPRHIRVFSGVHSWKPLQLERDVQWGRWLVLDPCIEYIMYADGRNPFDLRTHTYATEVIKRRPPIGPRPRPVVPFTKEESDAMSEGLPHQAPRAGSPMEYDIPHDHPFSDAIGQAMQAMARTQFDKGLGEEGEEDD
eukprot:CAMPEP_0177664422 /NCGR_PEP_ID=MMETSP0447-20121125/20485_1 /TAXON_ID=0 /ORGANISM="Stygamoeba regulata, Strain BSH-02190019" /LENGTH=529 /DNA_ID=CAMNT_0019170393 /DNA_START=179 /DNA_END=1765 /DNA_ORIENTATION=+